MGIQNVCVFLCNGHSDYKSPTAIVIGKKSPKNIAKETKGHCVEISSLKQLKYAAPYYTFLFTQKLPWSYVLRRSLGC